MNTHFNARFCPRHFLATMCLLLAAILLLPSSVSAFTSTYHGAEDGNWSNPNNWDNGIPGSGDDAIINANVSYDGGSSPSVNTLTILSDAVSFGISVYVANGAIFNASLSVNGTVVGNATFNGYFNYGTVVGNATFNGSAINSGTVVGNATFNGSAINSGTINGNATFNDSSTNLYNAGTVTGDACFAPTATNYGTVYGNITVCDITLPTVVSVSSDKADGNYTTGEVIDIDVTFSEAVTSTGEVTVTLETGSVDRTCTFTVSAADTGTCNYTVEAGDDSADLTVNSITGTIQDAALNSMNSPATPANNLNANKVLVIDTTAPGAPGTPDMTSGTDSGSSHSDNITNDTTPTFTVSCESNATTTLKESNTTLGTGLCSSSSVTITSSELTSGAHSITAMQIDRAGNLAATSSALSITIDTTSPTISITAPQDVSTITSFSPSASWGDATTCEYKYDSELFASLVCAANGTDIPTPSAGAHILTIRGTDTAANATTTAVSFTYSSQTDPLLNPNAPTGGSSGGRRSSQKRIAVASSTPSVLPANTFFIGDTGDQVIELQTILSNAGYLTMPPGVPLGYFGPLTQAAFARYLASFNTASSAPASTFTRNLALGDSGEDVRRLQSYLNARGYILSPSGPGSPGNETARFGALARAALARFQKANNIAPAAGYFGPLTRVAVDQ